MPDFGVWFFSVVTSQSLPHLLSPIKREHLTRMMIVFRKKLSTCYILPKAWISWTPLLSTDALTAPLLPSFDTEGKFNNILFTSYGFRHYTLYTQDVHCTQHFDKFHLRFWKVTSIKKTGFVLMYESGRRGRLTHVKQFK